MKEIKNMDLIISKFEGLKKFIYLKKKLFQFDDFNLF